MPQMLLASCPRLELLRAGIGDDLTVSSGSLRALVLCGQLDEEFETFELTIDAPKLETLLMRLSQASRTSIRLRSQDLRMAMLYSSCVLDKPCQKLRSLTLMGSWAMDSIVQLSRFLPLASTLSLQVFTSEYKMTMDKILSWFGRVETIHVDCFAFQSFLPGGVSKRKDLTLHLHRHPT
ncbi:uncharacterized protein LOC9655217 [Selaginella moellendorffii]|uniref:uncharacterized protein LOC9655217 n=1 Tax=Selaginella moellendorffii TaxID=88036 RepID=UPI000D1C321D|nr:uncharacterized protein LOC9655217 [Selaginella moellendorffii]|eukprot:XP_024521057.1 uncharacterized protein LOC9655217 [Selaginella moellendorffii]